MMAPPPTLTISQWADRERYLSPESSAEPGRWSTGRAEYQRAIMDAVGDIRVERVVVMKAAQVGWTECLNNACGYFMDQDPTTLLIIQPTLELATTWSRDRLAPMIRDTPVLTGKVADPKTRDSRNTTRQKVFPGGRLAIVGANAPAGLRSRPVRVVLADEVDAYPVSAGSEGDPLSLAANRQITYWNRKTLVGSTPTVKGASVIEREYEASNKCRFHVPCPGCGFEQHLKWAQVRWDKEPTTKAHKPETAYYLCEGCGLIWSDVDRWDAIKHGRWVAERPEVRDSIGFHIPGLLSSWMTLEDIVRKFLKARGDVEEMKAFTNNVLGETWEDEGEKVEGAFLATRIEPYGPTTIPTGVRLLSAGIDVQDDRLEVQVLGFGVNNEIWVIDYQVLTGDPSVPRLWKELDAYLLRRFKTQNERDLLIQAACIDFGGHHGAEVLAFCRSRRLRRIYAIKGAAGPRPIWPKRANRLKNDDKIYIVGVDTAKDALYGRLRTVNTPGPGFVHFPHLDAIDQEYFDQLTSEQVITRRREGWPYRVWVPVPGRKRHEALDTFVYALAARLSLAVVIEDRPAGDAAPSPPPPVPSADLEIVDPDPVEPMPRHRPPAQSPPRQPQHSGWMAQRPAGGGWFKPRGGSWFNR